MTRHHRITAGVGLVAVTALALLAGPLRAPAQEADATEGAGPSDETGTSVVAAPEIAVDSEISNGQPFGAWRVNCEALGPTKARDRGELIIDDIDLAADQFAELCKADLCYKRVFGILSEVTEEQIARVLDGAVATFLARYAPRG